MVPSKLLARAALLALPLLTSCAAPPSPAGEAATPIIGGTSDSGDPAVVLLASYPADKSTLLTCTAVLISPTVLLTAAHCVDAATHPGHTFGIFTGPDATAYDTIDKLLPELLAVSEVHAHPDYDPAPPFQADIGVVVLAAPLDIAPLPIARDPLAQALVGEPARIVGYGQIVYDDYNASKHAATTVVASLPEGDTVVVGDAKHRSCVGDSGGPALVKIEGVETVIGVDSYADTTGCIEAAHYRRTDAHAEFINTYAPPPEGSGGSGGSGGGSAGGSGGAGGKGGEGGSESEGGGCAVAAHDAGETSTLAGVLLPLALAAGLRRRRNRRAH